ncbi:aspartate--tRNA ligase [Glacieibacterium frigidum]|uniref:Aspartate--tRNA(Asp/Asn) ligase n=1 Tax=Glacieibacterium frigidum TaxID=2593303 RepID=A0A552UHW8_9SPHN|nr:aspartate--tRNA ligase [Glacieibacterium frigidum]TRW17818.1 aspartate--tRNA ligase [Glacieibacterium frigidum]
MHAYRTHTCAQLRAEHAGTSARLSGWVHRKRDHGGVLFIDLRDHYGLTQVVANLGSPVFDILDRLRVESVVTVTGDVLAREAGAVNPKMATGEIELKAVEVNVQSAANELPLPVASEADYPEEIRLKYRFLDLRRERLHRNIVLRSGVIASLRRRMIEQGFTEFQTPILTASSPEGARDFLVPSRVHPGKFYALPQAPQMFKQLLMVAGFDRYFQIAPCFRDEDARADRSPGEFYQLDFEMSFVTQDDVFAAIEPVLHGVFEEFGDKSVTPPPFPRIPYAESMLKYGNDKPDLRNPIEIVDVTELFRTSGFSRFAAIAQEGGVVRAFAARNAGAESRKFFDQLNTWAQSEGFAGVGYAISKTADYHNRWLRYVTGTANGLVISENAPEEVRQELERVQRKEPHKLEALTGPIAKHLSFQEQVRLIGMTGARPGDAIFFSAGETSKAVKLAGLARTKVGTDLGLIEQGAFKFCWIVDFPMFEYDEDAKKIDFSHNPFSMPQGELEALETQDPLTILAYQYDIVCNGIELSSGAIRNHRPDIMYKAFEIAGYTQADVDRDFAGMINAFKFGAPPHGGSAPGVDRIVMLLADEPNIREVVVFPMNQKAEDLMMNAPSVATPKQLRELSIKVVE